MKPDPGACNQSTHASPPPAGAAPDPDQRDFGPRQVIDQAASDIAHGLKDTDLHGIPSDVPGPGPAAEDSPGAEVPPEGGDRQHYAERQIGHKIPGH